MILVDTNIISTFMRIEKLDLLSKTFNARKMHISSNVFQELKVDKDRGHPHTKKLFHLIDDHKIEIVTPTKDELLHTVDLPESFGRGELDSIAICKKKKRRLPE